jgi:pimeloyl-ACP methyl ester carboxylesterase
VTLPDGSTIMDVFLSLGYAFATTSYSKNGYAVQQGGADLNALVKHFNETFSPASKVLVIGASEGGLVTTMLVERYPRIYHGGLAMCGPVGGAPYQVKYLGDFRAVFDYFFPDVFDFGVIDVPPDAFLNWENNISNIANAIATNFYSAQQLFRVTHAALDENDPTSSAIQTSIEVLFYSIWETNDLVSTAGGVPYENRSTWYSGSNVDDALNQGIERVASDRIARRYMQKYYRPSGKLKRPLVAIHTTQDPVVPFNHELMYLEKVTSHGRLRYYTLLPVQRYGHCTFTLEEVLGAMTVLLIRSGFSVQSELYNFTPSLPAPYQQ